jgi:hypothetical protein
MLFEIVITHRFESGSTVTLADLQALESRLMSVLSDKLAELTAAVDGVKTRIASLEANAATPEDLAAIEAAKQSLDSILPTPAPTPTPETPTPPTA